jgi:hypothetical protein
VTSSRSESPASLCRNGLHEKLGPGACVECRRAGRRRYNRKYRATEKGKVTRDRYAASAKGRAVQRAYDKSEKGKDNQRRYRSTLKGKAAKERSNSTESQKAAKRRYNKSPRGMACTSRYLAGLAIFGFQPDAVRKSIEQAKAGPPQS